MLDLKALLNKILTQWGGVFNLQVLRNILTPRKVVGVC